LVAPTHAADNRPRGYLATSTHRLPRPAGGKLPADLPETGVPPSPPAAANVPCRDGQEDNPHRLARLFLDQQFAFAGELGLRFWREEFHGWDGSAYRRIPLGEIRAQLTRSLAREFERLHQVDRARHAREQGEQSNRSGLRRGPRLLAVTSRLVTDVLQALSGMVLLPAAACPAQPAWIDGLPGSDASRHDERPARPPHLPDAAGFSPWPVDEILPARNALVHLPSSLEGAPWTLPPTPRFFNAFALDYDFVAAASEPAEWLDFLDQIWGSDEESIACLQEWFGYLLTPDTRQQKILMMVGPKRSGRGTIARVLKALVGENNVVNPTLGTLARPFGLSSLINKPVAIFPDARLSSRPDNAAIVECLLSISGEDGQTIDRKHLDAWTGRLPTRFVLISNELPRLRDASGALASRLILLGFTRSFYGREDTGLFDRLRRELPGILLWAIVAISSLALIRFGFISI